MSGSVAWLWAAPRETMGVEEITATPDWRAVFIPANLAPRMHGRNFRAVDRDVHGARRDIPATHIRALLCNIEAVFTFPGVAAPGPSL